MYQTWRRIECGWWWRDDEVSEEANPLHRDEVSSWTFNGNLDEK
jgi:hypothetical protein